jgi:hypothetical protein
MKTRKERLTEKAEFTIKYVTKELVKQTLVIEGIKNDSHFDFFDMQNQIVEILATLESQAKGLRDYMDMVESASDE